MEVRQDDKLVYDGLWKDFTGVRNVTLSDKASSDEDLTLPFSYVKRRGAREDRNGTVHQSQPAVHHPARVQRADPGPEFLSRDVRVLLWRQAARSSKYSIVAMDDKEPQRWLQDRRWLVTIAQPPPDLATFNGRIKLGVRASDCNYHYVSEGQREWGAPLDEDPRTPAHRQRVQAGQDRVLAPMSGRTRPIRGIARARAMNIPRPTPTGGFAYDHAAGRDENHYLLFDAGSAQAVTAITYGRLSRQGARISRTHVLVALGLVAAIAVWASWWRNAVLIRVDIPRNATARVFISVQARYRDGLRFEQRQVFSGYVPANEAQKFRVPAAWPWRFDSLRIAAFHPGIRWFEAEDRSNPYWTRAFVTVAPPLLEQRPAGDSIGVSEVERHFAQIDEFYTGKLGLRQTAEQAWPYLDRLRALTVAADSAAGSGPAAR